MNPKLILVFLAVVVLAFASSFFPTPKPDIALPAETVGVVLGFPVTNTLLATWATMAVLIIAAWRATRRMKEVPSGFQNLVEMVVEWLFRLVENVAGKNARRFFPLVATIFLFVIINNWMGLLPGYGTIGLVKGSGHGRAYLFNEVEAGSVKVGIMPPGAQAEVKEEGGKASGEGHPGQIQGAFVSFLRGANTSLSTTLALAIVAVVMVEYFGISTLGFFHYTSRFINARRLLKGNVMGVIDLFVGGLEAIAEFARLISFSFRLFGNMFAGEVLLLVTPFLIAWVFPVMFYMLEAFVGAIQALIFSLLTLVFAAMAVMTHGEPHEAHH